MQLAVERCARGQVDNHKAVAHRRLDRDPVVGVGVRFHLCCCTRPGNGQSTARALGVAFVLVAAEDNLIGLACGQIQRVHPVCIGGGRGCRCHAAADVCGHGDPCHARIHRPKTIHRAVRRNGIGFLADGAAESIAVVVQEDHTGDWYSCLELNRRGRFSQRCTRRGCHHRRHRPDSHTHSQYNHK